MHVSLLFIVSSQIEIISYQSSTRFHKSLYSKDFKKAFNDYYDDLVQIERCQILN
jgi:hypothetical protein